MSLKHLTCPSKILAASISASATSFKLPKVMREAEGFSFSGLKTAIAMLITENEEALKDQNIKAELAFAVQESIIDALCYKLKKALKLTGIKNLAVTGGVSANLGLRQAVKEISANVFFPDLKHCTDNAAMIGYVAFKRLEIKSELIADQVYARWPIESLSL